MLTTPDERIELVAVATPTGTHLDIGRAVLRSGRHLLLEKPLDVDLARTLEFAREAWRAESAGLVAAAVSQHRFNPATRAVHEAATDGRLGLLTSGVASIGWWRSQEYYDRENWRGTWAQDGGGALINQGMHTLDLLQWFLGPPLRVSATSRILAHARIEVEDTLAALIEFESGALATVHATTSAFPGLASRLQVMGTRGSAVIEHEALSYLHIDDGSEVGDMGLHGRGNQVSTPDHSDNRDATTSTDGHARQYADVASAIRGRRRTFVTVGDAVGTLATIHAIYRSATTGRPIELAEVFERPNTGAYRVGPFCPAPVTRRGKQHDP